MYTYSLYYIILFYSIVYHILLCGSECPRGSPGRSPQGARRRGLHIHIYIYTYMHIYIYIERERESEKERDTYIYIYIYTHTYTCVMRIYIYIYAHMYMYIYIYIYIKALVKYGYGYDNKAMIKTSLYSVLVVLFGAGRGTNGVSTHGVTAHFMFIDT